MNPDTNWTPQVARLRDELINRIRLRLTLQQRQRLLTIKISFNGRLRTTIGRACYRGNWIELNPYLIRKYPDQLAVTLAHELAHIVAPMLYGRDGLGHQIGWRKVMETFGYPAERTHRLEVGFLLRRHAVVAHAVCGCDGYLHPIKSRRYRKMTARKVVYKCVKCNRRLQIA